MGATVRTTCRPSIAAIVYMQPIAARLLERGQDTGWTHSPPSLSLHIYSTRIHWLKWGLGSRPVVVVRWNREEWVLRRASCRACRRHVHPAQVLAQIGTWCQEIGLAQHLFACLPYFATTAAAPIRGPSSLVLPRRSGITPRERERSFA